MSGVDGGLDGAPEPAAPEDDAGELGAGDRARLERLLGTDDLAWVLARLRRRLESGRDLTGTLVLRGADPAQRTAVAQLFGVRAGTGADLNVRTGDLEALLRTSGTWPAGLESAVVALTGPYVRRADARQARRHAHRAAWQPLVDALDGHPRPDLRAPLLRWWSGELTGAGTHRAGPTAAAAEQLARDAAAVLVRLPADGVAIGSLAHAATGRAHGLDRGPLAHLVLRAARVVAGLPAVASPSAEVDRETWAAVGVVRDETSSAVLCLGLPVATEVAGASDRALAAWGGVAQPVVLTLRHLRLDPPTWRSPGEGEVGVVWTVENPVVLTAVADRLLEPGASATTAAPAVVCTSGWPSAAALQVLRGLRAAGWQLRHHGDLDPDGLAITSWLVREVGARPWRMGVADHRAAVAAGLGRHVVVRSAASPWDPEVAASLVAIQQVVEEEAVIDSLLADVLRRRADVRGGQGVSLDADGDD